MVGGKPLASPFVFDQGGLGVAAFEGQRLKVRRHFQVARQCFNQPSRQGDLAAGFSIGVWMMLLTMVIVGLATGMLTTLPPIAGGPDTAVIAVIGLMAPAIAGPMMAAGLPLAAALVHVLTGITLVALASGLTMLALGLSGLGQSLRFVPYPLVAGFLAATGILLALFSLKIVTGKPSRA